MAKFLTENAQSNRREARNNLFRTKIWEALRGVLPRNMPEPNYASLSVPNGDWNGLVLSLDYNPKADEADALRRKISGSLSKKGMLIGKWERKVSPYSGDITYESSVSIRVPMFKGSEKLRGDRSKDAINIVINNARLAPGCRLEKVETIVPERKEYRFVSVCEEGQVVAQ